jgi:bifunctional UDP-N-acetylglucosamine pyrophosphorylase/glucosamine-1-phosphate N-acetyltransferase
MMARSVDGPVEAIILAAGKGTRMKSDLPKVLHVLADRPLLAHVLDTVRQTRVQRTVVVVGYQAEKVRAVCKGPDLNVVVQEPQLGTGHAVQVAAPALHEGGLTLVLNGDVPLLRAATLNRLISHTSQRGTAATVLTCVVPEAGSYGRIVKDAQGRVQRIVEARDATEEELAIGEFNTGVFCFRTHQLLFALAKLTNNNDQEEYYLTDTIGYLVAENRRVDAIVCDDPDEVVGINTVAELKNAEKLYRTRPA